MEDIKIHEFLKKSHGDGSGYGYGSGSGYGYGSGDGYSYGSGSGYGYGYGDGSGDGSGYGYDSGDGYSYGSGSGYGYGDENGSGDGSGYGGGYDGGGGDGNGDGSGYGYGYGYMIKKAKKHNIYNVDGINTIFYSIHKNVAKCAIFNEDFTFTPCYVVKGSGHFAHGETIKKAMKDLEKKIFNDMGIEEKIDAFLREFELDKKYPAHKFYEWHHKLTGSCEMGRKTFVENHNIDLDKDEFTVE